MPAALSQPRKVINLTAYYDAAETTSKGRDWGYFTAAISEDFYFQSGTRLLALGRLRREVRNNPYLAGLVNKYPEAIGSSNLRSRTSSREYNAKKDLWWFRWKKRVTNTGDSLRTLEDIVKSELLVAGEIFLVYLTNGKVQAIPSEYCGTPYGGGLPGEVNGIQRAGGTIIAYRFGQMEATGLINYANSTVINARYVLHIYAKDRVLMGRGLPGLLSSLPTARDLYEITRSKTKQIKDANSISGWIEKQGGAAFLQGLAAAEKDENTGEPIKEESTAPAESVSTTGPVVVELKPGTFIALEPGEKLSQLMSQYQASDYKELIMLMLHAISSPVGLPVELWFSGLGDVNYSGFKGLGTQWNARRRAVIAFLEEQFLNPLQFWRVSKAANEGDLPPNPDNDDDLIDWRWRRTAVLDEEKAAKSNQVRLTTGEYSLADIWEEEGRYAEEVFAERRQLWIKLQIAAGNLQEGANTDKIIVPEIFLLRGLLPGESAATPSPATDPVPDRSTQPAA
jgi:hypothetical protein